MDRGTLLLLEPWNLTSLEEKKRERPSMLPEDITSHLAKYIHAIRNAGGIINTAIVIAAGLGIVKRQSQNYYNAMDVMLC